ncbi:hypothetical protein BJ508DRAFT_324702 [Ascobolus immersus RN42]|uniref:Ribosome biogenesis protein SLX9 n=1 Tax=Ascobolus immersus RN42 TaxID=1160509 RepID=A0A3N4IFF1_ASCIM|nr:hypothetical protein BJ508DRAFT_324702 [Ascobolus immersus RN42]
MTTRASSKAEAANTRRGSWKAPAVIEPVDPEKVLRERKKQARATAPSKRQRVSPEATVAQSDELSEAPALVTNHTLSDAIQLLNRQPPPVATDGNPPSPKKTRVDAQPPVESTAIEAAIAAIRQLTQLLPPETQLPPSLLPSFVQPPSQVVSLSAPTTHAISLPVEQDADDGVDGEKKKKNTNRPSRSILKALQGNQQILMKDKDMEQAMWLDVAFKRPFPKLAAKKDDAKNQFEKLDKIPSEATNLLESVKNPIAGASELTETQITNFDEVLWSMAAGEKAQ